MNRKEKDKKHILPGVILVAFIASCATFFILLNIEKNALKVYEKMSVWVAKSELAKGLEINERSISECFEQVEIEKSKVPAKMISSPEELIGKRTELMISQGSVLTEAMFSNEEEYREGIYNPVIAGCKGDDLFQLVSGILRKGDLVHIYMVNDELGETYMLWENIMVYQAFDVSGNVIASEDTLTPAARVNLLLEEGYAEQFYNELNKGSLRLVKVWR